MNNQSILIRVNKTERDLLKKAVKQNGGTLNDYLKYRIFNCNPDISEAKVMYECPTRDQHNYLTIKMLQDVYLLLLNLITENKGAEGAMEIKRKCRDHAEKNIAKLGYLKVEHE